LINDINGNPIGAASACDWLYVVPWGFGKLLNWVKVRYNNPPIVITENGVAAPNEDTLPLQDIVNDNFRINYLSTYIDNVKKAVEQGQNIIGYFVWSLEDNFEWNSGYTKKFGMIYVNRTT